MNTDIHSLFHFNEIEITYRNKQSFHERPVLNDARKTYQLLLSAWNENKIELQEQFNVLMMDNACKAIGIFEISTGGIDFTPVDIRLLFATALKARATRMILSHNHPSGNLKPSVADIQITDKIFNAGKLLDIQIVDHIIITRNDYFSFADNGLMPTF